jgi:hypothetical protein
MVQHTKTGEYTKRPQNIPNKYQMTMEYTFIFHCKAQLGIFGMHIYHLATLASTRDVAPAL